jgi:hypothetical protein
MTLECARHRRRAALAEIDVWCRDAARSAGRGDEKHSGGVVDFAYAYRVSGSALAESDKGDQNRPNSNSRPIILKRMKGL